VTVVTPPRRVRPRRGEPAEAPRHASPLGWWLALAGVLALALALRVWGAGHGLPFAYNPDEASHFVPRAVGFFATGDLNPHYFINPPGFTYVLALVFAVRFGPGDAGVPEAFAAHPDDVFLVARLTAALLGTAAVWLVYLTGARLVDRKVGLLAAVVLAVAFLPVSWSHQAVNDVPATAPVSLALLGAAGILRYGRRRDFVVAGLGLGLAAAAKYTAGIAVLPIAAAVLVHERLPRRQRVSGLALAVVASVVAFLAANPYALLDTGDFLRGLGFLSVTPEGEHKLGQGHDNGVLYYLWALTWGLGWVPLVAAAAGAGLLLWRRPRLAAVLVPAPVLFILFMGLQERYFGRWLLPIFPVLCLLAGYAARELVDAAGSRRLRLARVALPVTAALLAAQGLVFSVHNGLVLSQTDTRNLTREWMLANVPARTPVFLERLVPASWYRGRAGRPDAHGRPLWRLFHLREALVLGGLAPAERLKEGIASEDYTRHLRPDLLDVFEARRVCLVVTGGSQRGRAEAEPRDVPQALAYYRALDRRGRIVYRARPYDEGAGPVPFDFDWSSNYYPLAYQRPGPEMVVYRLTGGRCASS
jgi:hypothetical protein